MTDRHTTPVTDPVFVTRLFNTTKFAWLWAVLRIYLGYQWLNAGWHKATGQGWLDGGTALKGFFMGAIRVPETGKPPITYDWYREFLRTFVESGAFAWFAKVIVYAEIAVGICLILGLLTGFAAFGGALMNFNFMMAGTASTNPVLFLIALLLILAWKAAGYWGADQWLLPRLGTPWRPLLALRRAPTPTEG